VFPVCTAQTAALAIQMKKYRNYGRIIISTFLAISKIIPVEFRIKSNLVPRVLSLPTSRKYLERTLGTRLDQKCTPYYV